MPNVDDDIVSNYSGNRTFQEVAEARISRRQAIGGGVATAVVTTTGVGSLMQAVPAEAHGGHGWGWNRRPTLGFHGIAPTTADTVTVPPGYTAKVLIAWGDPVGMGPEFRQDATNTWQDQEEQWGMHNDGMVYFPFHGSSSRGLLVQNHEYTDDEILFPDGTANWDAAKTMKSQAAHGVGIVEVRRRLKLERGDWWWQWKLAYEWEINRRSRYARRITAYTPMKMAGPAANDPRVGQWVNGTANNCAMGFTPWGTYLACEENFNGYFRVFDGSTNANGTVNNHPDGAHLNRPRTKYEERYGISPGGFGYRWHETDDRFDANKDPDEQFRFGWVVEINPFKPNSTPVKRTSLGRFKHEGAWVQEARDGRVVVYSGDDERFEYIYRYVSQLPWKKSFLKGKHPLDDGTLYVAKFNDDGTGEWLPLTPDNPALVADSVDWTMEEILINTRGAADVVGATKMDRPEWIDTFPKTLTAIATLTNNTARNAGNVDAANPRPSNSFGHIIKWWYQHDWTEDSFRWDFFALAGDDVVGDQYACPDGIYVDPDGLLWIQTDISSTSVEKAPYIGLGNNQMLAADPDTKETRRFLVGPKGCEVTGVFMTPDRRTMFVGIQHPGEDNTSAADPKASSSWPDGAAGQRPRSATVVITKNDGGEIGS